MDRYRQTLGLYRNCPGRENPAQSCLVCRGSPDRDLTFVSTNPENAENAEDRRSSDELGSLAECVGDLASTESMSYRRLSEKGKLSGPQRVNETFGCPWLTTQSTGMLRVGLDAVCPSNLLGFIEVC